MNNFRQRQKPIEMLRALIFDFNGVIVESTDKNAQFYGQIFSRYGHEVVERIKEHYKTTGGIPRQARIAMYLRDFAGVEPTAGLVEELSREFTRLYMDSLREARLVPGVREFFEQYDGKYDFFLSSGAPEEDIPEMLGILGLKRYFLRGFGAPRRKGEHVAFILKQYGYNPREVVFIGDSPKDREAAVENDIWFVARDRGLASLQQERFRIRDLYDLPDVLTEIEKQSN